MSLEPSRSTSPVRRAAPTALYRTPVDTDVAQAHQEISDIKAAGVDFDDIVARQLVEEGVKSFGASYDSLIKTIEEKASQLVAAG